MADRYIDPNSGAAPQPGGYAHTPLVKEGDENEEHPAGNVTMPDEANDPGPESEQQVNLEEVSPENLRAPGRTTELMENGGAELGTQPGEEDITPASEQGEGDSGDVAEPTDENADPAEGEGEPSEEAYDPSEHTVDDVVAYVEANPDKKADVVKAEEKGKNRSTLLSKLEG